MIRYELKRPSATKTAVILHYPCRDGVLKYYTGVSVDPSKFKVDNLKHITNYIERLQSDYNISGKKLLKSDLKRGLDKFLDKKTVHDFHAIVEKMESGEILTPSKKRYSRETIKSTRNALRAILAAGDPFSENFNDRLIVFCNKQKYSLNYTGTIIKRLKTLLRHTGNDSSSFKIIREETPDIALTETEINELLKKELPEHLNKIRDWFVLGCYLGLRVSDLLRLKGVNLSKDHIIISNEKTDNRVLIPIHPTAKGIIKKYKGFPPKVADQTLNKNIKIIAEPLFKEMFLYSYTRGGVRKDEYLPKWKMFSSHTCRRTFITNLLFKGVPDSIIMMLAGIKSHSTLNRYNKLTPEQAAEVVSKVW